MKTSFFRVSAASALLVVLAACGTDSQTSTVATGTDRGTLIDNPPLRIASLSAAAFTAELAADPSGNGASLLQLAQVPAGGSLPCGIDFNYVKYWTVGGNGEPETASAAMMVPTGSDPACSVARPFLLYGHGVSADKTQNLADITNPAKNPEGVLIAALFAAQGYIVVAPNYVGYDTSSGPYHPFLNEVAQSKDMIDALAASRSALGHIFAATTAGTKLFITGYSQGGYVAMATHKAIQADPTVAPGLTVSGASVMSGILALEAVGDSTFTGHVGVRSTFYYPMLITSYQKAYKNVYTQPSDFYEAAFAPTIEGLLPSATPVLALVGAGLLPPFALFNDSPPTFPGNAALTDALAVPIGSDPTTVLYQMGFGPGNLVKNNARVAYVTDALANPDNALVSLATDGSNFDVASTPGSGLRQDLVANDMRSWIPAIPGPPILMCGGSEDPLVPFQLNTDIMAYWWTQHGVPVTRSVLTSGLVVVLDLETGLDTGPYPASVDPFDPLVVGFANLKASYLSSGGQATVTDMYHGYLVPPFCTAATLNFFNKILNPPAG